MKVPKGWIVKEIHRHRDVPQFNDDGTQWGSMPESEEELDHLVRFEGEGIPQVGGQDPDWIQHEKERSEWLKTVKPGEMHLEEWSESPWSVFMADKEMMHGPETRFDLSEIEEYRHKHLMNLFDDNFMEPGEDGWTEVASHTIEFINETSDAIFAFGYYKEEDWNKLMHMTQLWFKKYTEFLIMQSANDDYEVLSNDLWNVTKLLWKLCHDLSWERDHLLGCKWWNRFIYEVQELKEKDGLMWPELRFDQWDIIDHHHGEDEWSQRVQKMFDEG